MLELSLQYGSSPMGWPELRLMDRPIREASYCPSSEFRFVVMRELRELRRMRRDDDADDADCLEDYSKFTTFRLVRLLSLLCYSSLSLQENQIFVIKAATKNEPCLVMENESGLLLRTVAIHHLLRSRRSPWFSCCDPILKSCSILHLFRHAWM